MRRTPVFVLACGFLILAAGMGTRFSFGLFQLPMTRDLGWSLQVFSFFMGFQAFMWGLAQPFAGMVADRFGPVRVAMAGLWIYAAGLVWMAMVESEAGLTLGVSTVIALGGSMAGMSVVFGAVVRAFPPERQSFVVGTVTAGASFGQLVFSPLAQAMIDNWGWSQSLLVMAAIIACASFLSLALVEGDKKPVSVTEQTLGNALVEASRHSGFLLLTAGFFVCGFHVQLIMTHMPAFAALCGLPAMVGALSLAIIGGGNIIGTNLSGYLGDHYRRKYLLSGIYFGRAVVIAVYIMLPITQTSTLIFSGAMGLLWLSTVPLTSGIIGQVFGTRWLATLFGVVFFSHQVGSFLGAWLGGYIFQQTGSYNGAWWVAILLGLFAGFVHLPIADRPVARLAPRPA